MYQLNSDQNAAYAVARDAIYEAARRSAKAEASSTKTSSMAVAVSMACRDLSLRSGTAGSIIDIENTTVAYFRQSPEHRLNTYVCYSAEDTDLTIEALVSTDYTADPFAVEILDRQITVIGLSIQWPSNPDAEFNTDNRELFSMFLSNRASVNVNSTMAFGQVTSYSGASIIDHGLDALNIMLELTDQHGTDNGVLADRIRQIVNGDIDTYRGVASVEVPLDYETAVREFTSAFKALGMASHEATRMLGMDGSDMYDFYDTSDDDSEDSGKPEPLTPSHAYLEDFYAKDAPFAYAFLDFKETVFAFVRNTAIAAQGDAEVSYLAQVLVRLFGCFGQIYFSPFYGLCMGFRELQVALYTQADVPFSETDDLTFQELYSLFIASCGDLHDYSIALNITGCVDLSIDDFGPNEHLDDIDDCEDVDWEAEGWEELDFESMDEDDLRSYAVACDLLSEDEAKEWSPENLKDLMLALSKPSYHVDYEYDPDVLAKMDEAELCALAVHCKLLSEQRAQEFGTEYLRTLLAVFFEYDECEEDEEEDEE